MCWGLSPARWDSIFLQEQGVDSRWLVPLQAGTGRSHPLHILPGKIGRKVAGPLSNRADLLRLQSIWTARGPVPASLRIFFAYSLARQAMGTILQGIYLRSLSDGHLYPRTQEAVDKRGNSHTSGFCRSASFGNTWLDRKSADLHAGDNRWESSPGNLRHDPITVQTGLSASISGCSASGVFVYCRRDSLLTDIQEPDHTLCTECAGIFWDCVCGYSRECSGIYALYQGSFIYRPGQGDSVRVFRTKLRLTCDNCHGFSAQ